MKFDRRLTDEIYTSDTVRLGKNAFQAMRETIYHNGGGRPGSMMRVGGFLLGGGFWWVIWLKQGLFSEGRRKRVR